MNKKQLETFKMSKTQMNNVNGGYNKLYCQEVQITANFYEEYGATDDEWKEWSKDFYRYCI